MKTVYAVLLFLVIGFVISSGCSAPYPTQTITVTDKFIQTATLTDWYDKYYVVDADGLAIQITVGTAYHNNDVWKGMTIGKSYLCEIESGDLLHQHYRITRVIKESK